MADLFLELNEKVRQHKETELVGSKDGGTIIATFCNVFIEHVRQRLCAALMCIHYARALSLALSMKMAMIMIRCCSLR